ncbi:hypothetical protein V1478_001072 [Vespula squamosa]|uniref:Uncharacterized protein n=1 Tax=Vespula squamosa TaxID=30214 RepID=A0ABD2C7B0_VESSQ
MIVDLRKRKTKIETKIYSGRYFELPNLLIVVISNLRPVKYLPGKCLNAIIYTEHDKRRTVTATDIADIH